MRGLVLLARAIGLMLASAWPIVQVFALASADSFGAAFWLYSVIALSALSAAAEDICDI